MSALGKFCRITKNKQAFFKYSYNFKINEKCVPKKLKCLNSDCSVKKENMNLWREQEVLFIGTVSNCYLYMQIIKIKS